MPEKMLIIVLTLIRLKNSSRQDAKTQSFEWENFVNGLFLIRENRLFPELLFK